MDTSAIKAMMAEIAPVIREYVAGEIQPYAERSAALEADNEKLAARLAEVEAREMPNLSGLCDAVAVKELIAEAAPDIDGSLAPLVEANATLAAENKTLVNRIAALEAREIPDVSGLCDATAVQKLIAEAVPDLSAILEAQAQVNEAQAGVTDALAERLADIETREVGIDEATVRSLIEVAIADLPEPERGEPGADGIDCDMEEVRAMVAEAVSALPPAEKGIDGKDGADCDMDAVAAMIAERVETAVKAIPAAKDGIGLANALKNSDGHLILTMTDGSTHDIGMIDGKDGQDGKTFTLDDFDIIPLDDPRDYKFCFTQGDTMHSFELEMPGIVDKAVWKEGAYRKGDGVTWAGNYWIAERDMPGKPDTADCGWRLAVKRGRDGKDAAK